MNCKLVSSFMCFMKFSCSSVIGILPFLARFFIERNKSGYLSKSRENVSSMVSGLLMMRVVLLLVFETCIAIYIRQMQISGAELYKC